MKVSESVRKTIDDWEKGDLDSAMLHACNAVDGTARKVYPDKGNRARFTQLLRDKYEILGRMGAPGVNLEETRFPVTVKKATAPDGEPDMADVLYSIIAAPTRTETTCQMALSLFAMSKVRPGGRAYLLNAERFGLVTA